MPIEPVDPSKKTGGDGSEKYTPTEKRGPSEFDKALEKEKAERARAEVSKMTEETRAKAEAERPRTYAERLQDMGYYNKSPKGGGGGGSGNGADIKMLQNPKAMKKGGKVKSASARADGIAIRGKTRA